MSFGGFIGNRGHGSGCDGGDSPYNTMSTATIGQPPPVNTPIAQPIFNSPAASVACKSRMEGGNFDPSLMGRIKEDGNESRSGSDNFEGGSGDDQDATGDKPQKKKKYNRHTPHQIQELENYFNNVRRHPDDKERLELGKKLSLDSKQVKFWFQNRRTQLKNQWTEMFPSMIGRTSIIDVIFNGMAGSRNCALQLMHVEFQALSPLVPVRPMNFLRFCKQHAEGVWAVVDVSVDSIREFSDAQTFVNCRRLPSGFFVQDMPNGYSKIMWVEHSEYDESAVHHLYRPLLRSGMGFGAQRWLATLQRQCECLAVLMSSSISSEDNPGVTPTGRRNMVKLAQRMTRNFCAGVCATMHMWQLVQVGNVGEDARLMIRNSMDNPGEPPGLVLSATTSVWMPVSHQRLFDFLRNEQTRSQWDELSHGGPMQEMIRITTGQDRGNCVSLLRATAANTNQNAMLILQETQTDVSSSLIVYTAVDIPAMQAVMSGGDSTSVALLPSGFAVVPDGFPDSVGPSNCDGTSVREHGGSGSGSLLTVGFQILVNNPPSAKLTMESVDTVNNLISRTIQRIKAALNCAA